MYTTPQFAKKIGVHPQTIRNWEKNNILKPAIISPSGRKYYTQDQVDNYLHGKMAPKK